MQDSYHQQQSVDALRDFNSQSEKPFFLPRKLDVQRGSLHQSRNARIQEFRRFRVLGLGFRGLGFRVQAHSF